MSILLRLSPQIFTSKCVHKNLAHCYYSVSSMQRLNSHKSYLLECRPTQNHIQIRHKSYTETVASIYADISNSALVHFFQQNLINFHELTGLPWWLTIIVTTILLRSVVTLPLAIYSNKIMVRLELISLEMNEIVKGLKGETALAMHKFKLTEQQARLLYIRSFKKHWKFLIERDNCHPLKTKIVLWGQIPLWICQSVALRNIMNLWPDPMSVDAQLVLAEFCVGGIGWIPNLTQVDGTLILPITLGIINLANIEVHALQKTSPSSKLITYATGFFRIFSIAMIPVAASVPSCLALYWTASSAYSLAQNLFLVSPSVKRFFRIPTNTRSHIEQPYRLMAQRLVDRINATKSYLTSFGASRKM